jgi:hypothetical protein
MKRAAARKSPRKHTAGSHLLACIVQIGRVIGDQGKCLLFLVVSVYLSDVRRFGKVVAVRIGIAISKSAKCQKRKERQGMFLAPQMRPTSKFPHHHRSHEPKLNANHFIGRQHLKQRNFWYHSFSDDQAPFDMDASRFNGAVRNGQAAALSEDLSATGSDCPTTLSTTAADSSNLPSRVLLNQAPFMVTVPGCFNGCGTLALSANQLLAGISLLNTAGNTPNTPRLGPRCRSGDISSM